jgi:hypothetical protein
VLNGVDIVVELGVLDLEMCLLHKVRDLLKLVKSIIWVVEHDAVENLGEVSVQIELDGASLVTGLLQLCLNALQSLQTNAHLFLIYSFNLYEGGRPIIQIYLFHNSY